MNLTSSHFLHYVVYMCQKSQNYVHAFMCYKQKCKVVSLNLAHPVYRRPTGRPSFTARLVGCSLRAPWSGVANSQNDRHRHCWRIHVGIELPVFWVFGVKLSKSRNCLRYFGSFNFLPLIKTFCISLSKLRGRLFTIFTAYIVCVFWYASIAIDFRRGRAQSTVQSIALHTVSRVDRVISTVYPL